MQNLYLDTRKLDESCREAYGLTDEIMMENAAVALENAIGERVKFEPLRNRVLILCGSGNNGADGYTLARRLRIHYDVVVFECTEPKSPLCILQKSRAEKCGTRIFTLEDFTLEFLESAAVIVDCIYGIGFHGLLDEKIRTVLNDVNDIMTYRIACDIPTGIDIDGKVANGAFKADLTVTMGALKLCLYQDVTKDFVGEVICADLGVGRRLFENSSNFPLKKANLLEESDMMLPHRNNSFVNKGTFGHVVIAYGKKTGAAKIAGEAALNFGAGLVTLVALDNEKSDFSSVSEEIMTSTSIPQKVSAIAFGMGLGRDEKDGETIQKYFDFLTANEEIPCIIDADVFYFDGIAEFLNKRCKKVVLTPPPKEFQSLLKICGFGEYSIEDCIMKRTMLIEEFCKKYPKCVLLVKGTNPMIGYFDGRKYNLYVNNFGRPNLAKAGSGDVLSGLIVALLSQKYKCLDATGTASLAHALASHKIDCDYALTPKKLIECVTKL